MTRVFLTGATGFLGGAIARALVGAGAEVHALVRSRRKAASLEAAGIRVHVGDLADPVSYRSVAERSDVVIHAAFQYADDGSEVRATEIEAVRALLDVVSAEGRARQLIYTSSVYLLGDSRLHQIDEYSDISAARDGSLWRLELESEVLRRGAAVGFPAAVIRCGLIYGGNGGTMPFLFSAAAQWGSVPFYGDGCNRWSLVYLNDAAALYVLVMKRRASGIFHAVDGVPLSAKRVAELASSSAGCEGRTHSIPLSSAAEDEHVGRALSRDCAATGNRAMELGWAPTFESFEVGAPRAFEEWSSLSAATDPT